MQEEISTETNLVGSRGSVLVPGAQGSGGGVSTERLWQVPLPAPAWPAGAVVSAWLRLPVCPEGHVRKPWAAEVSAPFVPDPTETAVRTPTCMQLCAGLLLITCLFFFIKGFLGSSSATAAQHRGFWNQTVLDANRSPVPSCFDLGQLTLPG